MAALFGQRHAMRQQQQQQPPPLQAYAGAYDTTPPPTPIVAPQQMASPSRRQHQPYAAPVTPYAQRKQQEAEQEAAVAAAAAMAHEAHAAAAAAAMASQQQQAAQMAAYGAHPQYGAAAYGGSGSFGGYSGSFSASDVSGPATPLTNAHGHHHGGHRAGGRGHQRDSGFVAHEPLPMGDKLRGSFERQLAPHGAALIGAVKLGGPAAPRKRFLAYRARTEEELVASLGRGTPKWGHGGEGNEQRRYVPLRVACWGQAGIDGQSVCQDPTCDACRLMATGFKLQKNSASLHLMTTGHVGKAVETSFATAVMASNGNADSLSSGEPSRRSSASATPPPQSLSQDTVLAFAVCRVVVGNPLQSEGDLGIAEPVQPHHSLVVSNSAAQQQQYGGRMAPARGGGYQNVAQEAACYIFRDDAVDAQHIVFFRPTA